MFKIRPGKLTAKYLYYALYTVLSLKHARGMNLLITARIEMQQDKTVYISMRPRHFHIFYYIF